MRLQSRGGIGDAFARGNEPSDDRFGRQIASGSDNLQLTPARHPYRGRMLDVGGSLSINRLELIWIGCAQVVAASTLALLQICHPRQAKPPPEVPAVSVQSPVAQEDVQAGPISHWRNPWSKALAWSGGTRSPTEHRETLPTSLRRPSYPHGRAAGRYNGLCGTRDPRSPGCAASTGPRVKCEELASSRRCRAG